MKIKTTMAAQCAITMMVLYSVFFACGNRVCANRRPKSYRNNRFRTNLIAYGVVAPFSIFNV